MRSPFLVRKDGAYRRDDTVGVRSHLGRHDEFDGRRGVVHSDDFPEDFAVRLDGEVEEPLERGADRDLGRFADGVARLVRRQHDAVEKPGSRARRARPRVETQGRGAPGVRIFEAQKIFAGCRRRDCVRSDSGAEPDLGVLDGDEFLLLLRPRLVAVADQGVVRHDPLQRRVEFLRIGRFAVRSDGGHPEGRRLLRGDIALGRLDPDVERVGVERNLHRLRNPSAAVFHDADEEQKVEHRRRRDVGFDFVFRRRRSIGVQTPLSERVGVGFELPFPVAE